MTDLLAPYISREALFKTVMADGRTLLRLIQSLLAVPLDLNVQVVIILRCMSKAGVFRLHT